MPKTGPKMTPNFRSDPASTLRKLETDSCVWIRYRSLFFSPRTLVKAVLLSESEILRWINAPRKPREIIGPILLQNF
jgi:hypothetical protein